MHLKILVHHVRYVLVETVNWTTNIILHHVEENMDITIACSTVCVSDRE
jgi:hypothetical protein